MPPPLARPPLERPHRLFEGARIWRVNDDLLSQAATLIADAEHAFAPDLIVGIARGGIPLADHLTRRLCLPQLIIPARHNPDDRIEQAATGHVTLDPGALTAATAQELGQRLLLVDDICGSGATLLAVQAALEEHLKPAHVRTATLCRNSGSAISPDTWIWDVSDWTVFPGEQPPGTETEDLPVPTLVRHR